MRVRVPPPAPTHQRRTAAARYFWGGFSAGLTRAPQAHTIERVRHSIRSRRPQAWQATYVPGRFAAETAFDSLALGMAEGGGELMPGAPLRSIAGPDHSRDTRAPRARSTSAIAASRKQNEPITQGAPKRATKRPATTLPSGMPPRKARP